jgi:hypothetical protein
MNDENILGYLSIFHLTIHGITANNNVSASSRMNEITSFSKSPGFSGFVAKMVSAVSSKITLA